MSAFAQNATWWRSPSSQSVLQWCSSSLTRCTHWEWRERQAICARSALRGSFVRSLQTASDHSDRWKNICGTMSSIAKKICFIRWNDWFLSEIKVHENTGIDAAYVQRLHLPGLSDAILSFFFLNDPYSYVHFHWSLKLRCVEIILLGESFKLLQRYCGRIADEYSDFDL